MHRQEFQQASRKTLEKISKTSHKDFANVIASLDENVTRPVLEFPDIKELIDIDSIKNNQIKLLKININNIELRRKQCI